MNHSNSIPTDRSSKTQGHTSEQEAVRITQQDDVPELVEFILILKMKRPISTDKAARLLKHMVKQQMASDTSQIADQMRDDGWEAGLSAGETLPLLADRVLAYLATHEGIALFNFFVKTFAKTNGEMFE
jgi:hypothetical protein